MSNNEQASKARILYHATRTCSGAGKAETPGYQWGRKARDGSPGQDPASKMMKHIYMIVSHAAVTVSQMCERERERGLEMASLFRRKPAATVAVAHGTAPNAGGTRMLVWGAREI